MTHRQRGAAQVGMIGLILAVVIALVSILFAYLQMQEVAKLETQLTTVKSTATQADARTEAYIVKLRAITDVVGFGQDEPNPTAIQASIDELANTFPGAADSKTLQAVVGTTVVDYNAAQRQNRDLAGQVSQLRNDLTARQRETTAAIGEKDTRVRELERELEDTKTSFNTQVLDLERQRDGLRDQVRELDSQVSELRTQMDDSARAGARSLANVSQRNKILSERLNSVERRSDEPDGLVLSASAELGQAWVDLGRTERLRAGMEFDVHDPRTGAAKGRIKITQVGDRRSAADILAQGDRFDPIGPDDTIRNAVYDPNRTPIAVLLGNGFGRYSGEELRTMLGEVGIRVASEISNDVDYLILGTPFFDAETGDLVPWSTNEIYKAAESAAVQVLPLRDAMDWLGL